MSLLLLGLSCGPSGLAPSQPTVGTSGADSAEDDVPSDDTDDTEVAADPGPLGFIGSPCASEAECEYEDPVCLTDGEGFPQGTCSQACDLYCPDEDGFPITFCVPPGELPADAGGGSCLARCDYGLFPGGGCREGYGCARVSRNNEPSTEAYACLPGAEAVKPTACQEELIARGVRFSPIVMPSENPSDHPSLTCTVEDPVQVFSPINGVELLYYDGSPTPTVKGACNMALALADTVDDVKAQGAVALLHIGTYNCRVISGTDTLSRHAYGDAIDIYGFELSDGTTYTLVDDWEHDTSNPSSAGAQYLYDAAYRWYDAGIWAIILTPNYNAAHDNHFHVDLTPNAEFIRAVKPGYIGVAPLRPAPDGVGPVCVH